MRCTGAADRAGFEIVVFWRRPRYRRRSVARTKRWTTLGQMNPNPYQSGNASAAAPRTRATRWMIWTGAGAFLLAILCVIATVLGAMRSFDAIAPSSTPPKPSDLANVINFWMIPSAAAAPLAIIGIVLLILGFVRRRPVSET